MISISSLIGKPTINPILFFSGKLSGYLTWISLLLMLCNVEIVDKQYNNILINTLSLVVLFMAFVFIILSNINLGRSNRLGLPEDNTALKTGGIYRISRNPMYVGFDLLTVSSMLYSGSVIVAVLGMYSIIIYHVIILSEEKFLKSRFGEGYLIYRKKVRRYI